MDILVRKSFIKKKKKKGLTSTLEDSNNYILEKVINLLTLP